MDDNHLNRTMDSISTNSVASSSSTNMVNNNEPEDEHTSTINEISQLPKTDVIGDEHPLSMQQKPTQLEDHINNNKVNEPSLSTINPDDDDNDKIELKSFQRQSSTDKKMSSKKDYLYQICARLLGIRFLRNERKGFEQEVERSMHQLIQKNLMLQKDLNDNSHLPSIQINIPNAINDFVDIEIQDENSEQLFQLIKNCNEEFFLDFKDKEDVIRQKLLLQPIRILVNHLFLYRGQLNTPVERCLTMTTIFQQPTMSTTVAMNRYQQCLVILLPSPAKVTEVLNVFRKLHGITNHFQPLSTNIVTSRVNEFKVVINAEVEIQEEVAEGKWQTCPREKDSFKIRTNVDKRILINLQQDLTHHNFPMIRIERCFGMLLSSGRNVSPNQMVAIGLNSMSSSIPNPETAPSQQQWQIVASWIPSELGSDLLNTETPRNSRIYFTIALDLILENVEEPIRFVFESKAKIIPASISATEKLWKNFTNLSKTSQRCLQECFSMIVRQRPDMHGRIIYEVVSCLSSTQIAMQKQRLSLQLNFNKIAESSKENGSTSSPVPEEQDGQNENQMNDDDDDEPLQSGSGLVRKECSQNELQAWQSIMEKWNRENLSVRPKQLNYMVRKGGIPQALRPEVWQLLSRAHEVEEKILPKYKLLVTQESTHESIILRDISRTFTAHEKFRDAGSEQELLFRICKAYSNYDAEIGYCQGLSYLVAALLLNMPEEQAFCVLVQIMYRYGLRDLFKSGLENLHCKFYQLERLLDEQIPELYFHFMDLHIEAHMYASQWFLTLFTTKFPLNVVFMIIDIFLLEEMDVILQIALGLLQMSKSDLLALDFEGIMKYFRITLPKLYRNDDAARELIRKSLKINVKKAKKYETQYIEWREKNRDPLELLQTENKRLMQTVARLEQENEDIAHELLGVCQSKIRLKTEFDLAEDKAETLNSLLTQARTKLVDSDEDRRQLAEELKNLKDMCRKEIDRHEFTIQKNQKIIEEYKQICKNYQEKFEKEQKESREKMEKIVEQLKPCEQCTEKVQKILDSDEDSQLNDKKNDNHEMDDDVDSAKQELYKRIADLEAELIKTKIALAESEDRNGQLVGKLHTTNSELNLLKAQNDERAAMANNTWLSKTLSSLRDAATAASSAAASKQVKPSNSMSSGISTVASGANAEYSQQNQDHEHQQPKIAFRRNSSKSDH